ncbi:redox-regulated ATPase YchF [Patescibacteria group bacterium]|nr:redox-regulated ATPase YchF [Patescibacteria group bacterium]
MTSNLKVGIVGLPNVGKSTLFNAILKRQLALAANYPFATIEPNIGIAEVPDQRLEKLSSWFDKDNPPPIVETTIKFVDIAGLVKGASKGEGLGNQFLTHIREASVILQVVRSFSDQSVVREGSTDPDSDTEIINTELILKDLEIAEKKLKTIGADPKRKEEKTLLEKVLKHLSDGRMINLFNFTKEEEKIINELSLLTQKPIIYAFNIDEAELKNLSSFPKTYKGRPAVYFSAKIESEISLLSEKDQIDFFKDLEMFENGLDRLVKACYDTLDLISFLTIGKIEARAWTVKKGTFAPQAAGVIHSDFEKNFIKAKVINWENLIKTKSWADAAEKGLVRQEGKDYEIKDGDVIEFMIGK